MKQTRNVLALLLAVCLIGSLLLWGGGLEKASAAEAVDYFDPTDGKIKQCTDYEPIEDSGGVLISEWYVVTWDQDWEVRATVAGNVNLILCDGVTLNIKGGIKLPTGCSLTIWGQQKGTGVLNADASDMDNYAGIGGGDGSVAATEGDLGTDENCGSLTVNGGTITAKGGVNAAGIGGGCLGDGGTISFNYGTTTAIPGKNAQAVGMGNDGASSGSVSFGEMKVFDNEGAKSPVEADQRETACRGNYARIEACLEHRYSYTYTETEHQGTCDWCEHKGEAEAHTLTHHTGKAATCTEEGIADWDECSVCLYSSYKTLPALGHLYVGVVTAPTCTEKGYTTYTCSRCDDSYTADETDALGHDYVPVVTAPTCTEKGYTTYTCSRCDDSYTDDETDALGHDYALSGWTWSGYESAAASFTCKNDASHVQTVNAEITSVRTEPTADANGSVVYTASVTFEGTEYTDTKTEILPAIGHEYEFVGWEWEGVEKACAVFADKNTAEELRVDASISCERTEPTCDASGTAVYTATAVFEGKTYTDEKTQTLEALGHDWGEPSYTWNEDFSKGTAIAICNRDSSHAVTETVSTNFILTKPSTYANTGAGYFVAAYTNELFTTQTHEIVIPAVGCDGGPTCPSLHFTDRPPVGNWAHIPIDWAVVNRITVGTSATTFSPNRECTRAQFVTFLWRTSGQPEPGLTENPFTDAKDGDYFYKAVLWAVENNITAGTSSTTFSPNDKCTRAQVVTFLWRYEGSEKPTQTVNPFTDVKSGAYYYDAVLWAVEKDITAGTSETTFSPNGYCTRVQCVTFLYREFAK